MQNPQTVEDLEELLQKTLQDIENIALQVAEGQKDTSRVLWRLKNTKMKLFV
jgi:hypothetical protein